MNAKQRRQRARATYTPWSPPPPVAEPSEGEPEQLWAPPAPEAEADVDEPTVVEPPPVTYARHVEEPSRWRGYLAAALTGVAVGFGLMAFAAAFVVWGWL